MTLTVRLDQTLESALDRFCAAHGVTKSLVVQQSLAAYLVQSEPAPAAARVPTAPSAAFAAFRQAGLIDGGELDAVPADKAAVRRRATQASRRRPRPMRP